jgi:hypothetical protein
VEEETMKQKQAVQESAADILQDIVGIINGTLRRLEVHAFLYQALVEMRSRVQAELNEIKAKNSGESGHGGTK